VVLAVAWFSAGCPRAPHNDDDDDDDSPLAKVYVLLSSGDGGGEWERNSGNEVEFEEIQNLVVRVTQVSLRRASEIYEVYDDCDEDGGALDTGNTWTKTNWEGENEHEEIIFDGAVDVDLMALTDLSALIASAEIYPGRFTKIRLAVEEPRLVLASHPDEVITDVQLTANGHLFVSKQFELEEGDSRLLALRLEGIHLVEAGKCRYVLTPQLRAELEWVETEALVVGHLTDVDPDNDTLVVALEDGTEVTVVYAEADIYLPADTDVANGTETDLSPGQEVEIRGTFWVDGSMDAGEIRIYEEIETES
jgi:hypothetical protein